MKTLTLDFRSVPVRKGARWKVWVIGPNGWRRKSYRTPALAHDGFTRAVRTFSDAHRTGLNLRWSSNGDHICGLYPVPTTSEASREALSNLVSSAPVGTIAHGVNWGLG